MNAEDFCTYEQALALKKLGFRESCLYHYNILNEFVPNNFNAEDETVTVDGLYDSLNTNTLSDIVCDVPTLAQVQKWFRVRHEQSIEPKYDSYQWWCCMTDMFTSEWYDLDESYSSYEEALSAGITECLKLLEKDED